MRALGLVLALLWAVPVAAQTRPQTFDAATYAGVAADLGFATWQAWQAPARRHALTCEGVRIGVSIAAAELTKHVVHEWRPDHSDQKSFYSEHTAISAAAPSLGWGVGFSLAVGIGRVAADKHHPLDVGVGMGAGLLTHALCR